MLKDPRSRISLLLPPVVQALIFGYAATYDLNHVTYAVLDQDHSAASRELLAGLDGSGVFERVAILQRAGRHRPLDRRARARCWCVQIEPALRAAPADRAERRDVQLIADGRNSNTAGTALGYVSEHRRAASTPTGARRTAPRPAAGAGRARAPGTTRISRHAGT